MRGGPSGERVWMGLGHSQGTVWMGGWNSQASVMEMGEVGETRCLLFSALLVYQGCQCSTSARIPPGTGDSFPSEAALSESLLPLPGRVGRGLGLGSEDLVLRSCLSCPDV